MIQDYPKNKKGNANNAWTGNQDIYDQIMNARKSGLRIVHRVSMSTFEVAHNKIELDEDGNYISSAAKDKPWMMYQKIKDEDEEESTAEGLMRTFKNPDRAISDKFEDWNADTHRLTERAEFIEEYTAILDRIEKQELAGYRQQFKQYLNDEMITKMSDSRDWLERQKKTSRKILRVLNKSLKDNFRRPRRLLLSYT
ncbi:hypothetical protein FQR65_LT20212 [Abscondita terminalis]|nr:hypothetical protein FQR65_LT20212 [Abscondita terminalis]